MPDSDPILDELLDKKGTEQSIQIAASTQIKTPTPNVSQESMESDSNFEDSKSKDSNYVDDEEIKEEIIEVHTFPFESYKVKAISASYNQDTLKSYLF